MRALASALLVLTVGLLACDNEGLVVRVEGLSPDVTALRVRFLRDGQLVSQDREITRTLQQFVVTGVEGGDYQLDIAGLGSDRCIVARQSQPISYRGGSLRPTDVSVRLSPDPAKPCPILVTVDDGVSVTSTPKGIACGNDTQGQPLRDCVIDIPRGNDLTLQGQTKDGFATYPAFSGLCLAIDSCLFKVEKAGEVRVVAAKRVCNDNGWCVQNPIPQPHTLNALWGFAADDIWAVGLRGTVLHYDGRMWTSIDAGVKTDFYAVWGAKSGDVWVVGDRDGLTPPISHYQQGKWETVNGNGDLRSIYGSAGNNIWALGNSGFAMHYDGANWKESTVSLTGRNDSIAAHWLDDSGNGWMINRYGIAAILEKDSWAAIGQQTFPDIYSIHGADKIVWAAGYYGIAHTSGKAKWQEDILPKEIGSSPNFRSIFPISANDVWAAGGNGLTLHWDGIVWTVKDSGTRVGTNALWGASTNNVWAVGAFGLMLHWDGVRWSQYSRDAAVGQDLQKSWGAAANDVHAVGRQGTISHWDGHSWRLATTGRHGDIRSVWGSGPDRAWAGGDKGLILRYDTATGGWDDALTGSVGMGVITDIWLGQDSKGWAVSGKNIIRIDDMSWKTFKTLEGMEESLNTVWGTSPQDIYAVGYKTSYHYDSSKSVWLADKSTYDLSVLWGVPGGTLWSISQGSPACLAQFFSGNWSTDCSSELGSGNYRGIWGRSLQDITVVGENPQNGSGVFQFQAGKWKKTYQGSLGLNRVWGTSDGHVWAVGQYGTILHQGPPGSRPVPNP